jgi:antirestriction protein ArdC
MEVINEDTGLPLLDNKGNPVIEEVEVTIPNFKAVPVFDVSQTDGKEIPTLADELKGGVTEYKLRSVHRFTAAYFYTVRTEPHRIFSAVNIMTSAENDTVSSATKFLT